MIDDLPMLLTEEEANRRLNSPKNAINRVELDRYGRFRLKQPSMNELRMGS